MVHDLKIIQTAIGDKSAFENSKESVENSKYFSLYSVNLTERFKGLPLTWYFGVLTENSLQTADENQQDIIIEDARKLIVDTKNKGKLPLVMISNDQNIRLKDNLLFGKDMIFFLDKIDLQDRAIANDVKNTPFLLSARNKFTNTEVPLLLSPYSPDKPAESWRFFGRKKEIKDLVESTSNYFILGARKIGKTSLLKETKRRLEAIGHHVYWVPVQHAQNIQEVIEATARLLSASDYYQANKSAVEIGTNYLESIIKKLKRHTKNLVLIYDEIGNVLSKNERDGWRFMGTLREISQNNDVRIFFSAFQETLLKQYSDFEGPFVNFGTTIKIRAFDKTEIDEILVHPLDIWGDLGDKKALNKLIRNKVGSHPLLLQYLGKYLFQNIFNNRGTRVDQLTEGFLESEEIIVFENAITEIFIVKNTYLERFVFLQLCDSAAKNDKELSRLEIRNVDVEKLLNEIGIATSLDQQNFLLDRLSLRGLLSRDKQSHSIYRIASPIVYHFMNRFYSIEQLCNDLKKQIKKDELSLSY